MVLSRHALTVFSDPEIYPHYFDDDISDLGQGIAEPESFILMAGLVPRHTAVLTSRNWPYIWAICPLLVVLPKSACMARINRYLHKIGAADTDLWTSTRDDRAFSISTYQAGGTTRRHGTSGTNRDGQPVLPERKDGLKWTPNLQAVRAAVRFVIDTERLNANWIVWHTNST